MGREKGHRVAADVLLVVVLGLACHGSALSADSIERVSVASDGTQGNGSSYSPPSISADGRLVAFRSSASNLVADDTNGSTDVFVYDRQTGQTSCVSVASDGTQGNDGWLQVTAASVSADGRFVVFASAANNLVADDTNGTLDIFVHDRQTRQTSRISIASDGTQANGISRSPSISADGRFVVFASDASNLVPGDTNGYGDVFVHDRQTSQTSRVSVASEGTQGNAPNIFRAPSISADGRFVAFSSAASNLVEGDTNGKVDVFVHDRQTGQTTRVSVASDGTQGNSHSSDRLFSAPTISADGRFVVFSSAASNLVEGDTNGKVDVFVHDRQTGQTTRVSVASDGTQGNDGSDYVAISIDGRLVAFESSASNLVPDDTNGSTDVFVYDRQTGQTSRISIACDGTQANGYSASPSISADGRLVAFRSSASNLVPDDTNGFEDVFVLDRGLLILTVQSMPVAGIAITGDKPGMTDYTAACEECSVINLAAPSSFSNIGTYNFVRWIVDRIEQPVGQLAVSVPMSAHRSAVAVYQIQTWTLTVQSTPITGVQTNGDKPGTTDYTATCDDGSVVMLTDPSGVSGGAAYRFVRWIVDNIEQPAGQSSVSITMTADHTAVAVYVPAAYAPGTTKRVSIASDGTEGDRSSFSPSISANGRFVAFESGASNLVQGDTISGVNIFVHDLQRGQTGLASMAADGMPLSRSYSPAISADGRFVAFEHMDRYSDVFLYDRQTADTHCVSVDPNGGRGDDFSSFNTAPSISGDGRFVAFWSSAKNIVLGDTNGFPDVFVRDCYTDHTSRASVASDGTQGNGWSSYKCSPSTSADGRFVAFCSRATNLVPDDTNDCADVFVHDRHTGQTSRVSIASDGAQADESSSHESAEFAPSISTDGRFVAFVSSATNLVSGDTNGELDVFVHDRQTGETSRVSVASYGTQGNGPSTFPSITADGRFVAFESDARNLVPDDSNLRADVFVHDRLTKLTRRISVDSGDQQASGQSSSPSISADGRFVAFWSDASNLVPDDTNGFRDVFVRDRGVTLTVQSTPVKGVQIAGDKPGMTDYVAPCDQGSTINLTAFLYIANGGYRFLRWIVDGVDQPAGELEVGVTMSTHRSAVAAYQPQSWTLTVQSTPITGVVITGDTPGTTDYSTVCDGGSTVDVIAPVTATLDRTYDFVRWVVDGVDQHDGLRTVTIVMSTDKTAVAVYQIRTYTLTVRSAPVGPISITGNGNNGGKTNYTRSCEDRDAVILTAPSTTDYSGCIYRFVRWRLDGADQIAGQTTLSLIMGAAHTVVAVYEVQTWTLTVRSTTVTGIAITGTKPGTSDYTAVCDGGSTVELSAPGTVNNIGIYDFTRWIVDGVNQAPGLLAVSIPMGADHTAIARYMARSVVGTTQIVSVATDGTQGNGYSSFRTTPSISADGRFVAFVSDAVNLVPETANPFTDVYVHDCQTGETDRVSVSSDGAEGDYRSISASISANGRFVAFCSLARNLVEGDTYGMQDVFIHDRHTSQTSRVSVASDGTQGNGMSGSLYAGPGISADGRLIAFQSFASNLVPDDTNGFTDVFVHDRQTGQTSRVSVASNGTQADDYSASPSISADGRLVAFESSASNLVPDDTNGSTDVFLYDRQTGQTSRISIACDGTQANGYSASPSISADGRLVAFRSSASNLVPDDTNGSEDVFVHDRQTGQIRRVSVASEGTPGNGNSWSPNISADGRFVAFASSASNLVPGDTNGLSDIFVHDLQVCQTSRVSIASDGTQGNAVSAYGPDSPSISADGRLVAFGSIATNLVACDANGKSDVFVHNRGFTLAVSSAPITGVQITGDRPGMTGYTVACDGGSTVSLAAPTSVIDARSYSLAYWKVNGLAQQPRQACIQVRVETHATAEAIYQMLGDCNGDCTVNVLDLILIRNRLGKPVGSDDNWRADMNLNGSVDVLDLIITRNKLGTTCP